MQSAWVTVTCPCCGHQIEVRYYPGKPAVYYPNDKAHPEEPPSIDDFRGCGCHEYISTLKARTSLGYEDAYVLYEERLIERVKESDL